MKESTCVKYRLTMRIGCRLAVMAVCALSIESAAWGDVFVLKTGGQIRGRWLNRGERPFVAYEIETNHGGRLKLAKAQVEAAISERPAVAQYEQMAPTYGDSIEEQWKLAEWCRENTLLDQRKVHLRRILEIDPDHPQARRGLGYSQLDGRWVTRDQWRKEQGYHYYQGRWRNSHEIAILEERHEHEQAERQWLVKLKRMRDDLAGERGLEAREEFLAIRDPHALRGLVGYLQRDPNRAAGFLYLEAIRNIGTHGSAEALVAVSLSHGDVEIFYESIEQLAELAPPGISKPYIDALKDENNVRINRAAFALGRLGQKKAIGPLIDSLTTTHKIVIAPPRSNNAITTTFSRPGSGAAAGVSAPGACRDRGALTGLTAGNQTKVITTRVNNQEVLDALVKLSEGASFGFDQQAWNSWYEQEKAKLPTFETRGE